MTFLEEYKDHLELDFVDATHLKVYESKIIVDNTSFDTKLLNLDSVNLTAIKGALRLVVFYQPILMKPKHIKRERLTDITQISCRYCHYVLVTVDGLKTTRKPWDGWYESLSECFCHKTKWTNPALSNEDLMTRNKILISDFDIWVPNHSIQNCPNCDIELGTFDTSFSMLWKWKLHLTNSFNYSLSDCIAEYLYSASLRGDFIIIMACHTKCTAIQILNTFSKINQKRCIKFLYYPIDANEIHLPLNLDIYEHIIHLFKSNTLVLPIDKRLNGKSSFLYLK